MSTRNEILKALDHVFDLVEALPEVTPAPTPAPLSDDPDGTWRTGEGSAAVRWKGAAWRIGAGGTILRDDKIAEDTKLTADAVGLGILSGVLVHETADGRRWAYTGFADWRLLSTPVPEPEPPPAPPPSGSYQPGTPQTGVRQWIRRATDPAALVPADFVGMHLHNYPSMAQYKLDKGGKPTPKPTYGYGARRLWDYSEASAWRAIDVGYNDSETTERRSWAVLDEVIDTEIRDGHSVMLTINGTPTRLSSQPTGPGKYPAWPGSNYSPKDAAAFDKLRKYIADLVARYGSKIRYIDSNNEPDPDNPIPNKDNFWVGSRPQHAEWHRQIRLGVPRGPGAPLVIGPSQVFWSDLAADQPQDYGLSVLVARDTQGVRLVDHLDGYGFHYYVEPDADPIAYWQAIRCMRSTVRAAGKGDDFPIFDTEHGKLDKHSADPVRFARRIQRDCAIAAGAGLAGIYLYSGDGPNLDNPSAGGPMGPAISQVQVDLPGLEVREAAILADGRVWLRGLRAGVIAEVSY